jgi:phycocyanobilin lyase beta subunit
MTMMASASNLAALIQAVETADSKAGIVMAVRELAAAQDPEAIPTLIQVLGYNNPGAAVAAVDGLVALGRLAVPSLLEQLDGYNYGARAWAIRALSLIGDPRALDILIATAEGDFALSVRRAAAKGIGTIDWNLLSDTDAAAAQTKVMQTLIHNTADPEWVVRYAAVVGLQALAIATLNNSVHNLQSDHHPSQLIAMRLSTVVVEDDTPAVQARARLALETLQAGL